MPGAASIIPAPDVAGAADGDQVAQLREASEVLCRGTPQVRNRSPGLQPLRGAAQRLLEEHDGRGADSRPPGLWLRRLARAGPRRIDVTTPGRGAWPPGKGRVTGRTRPRAGLAPYEHAARGHDVRRVPGETRRPAIRLPGRQVRRAGPRHPRREADKPRSGPARAHG